MAADDAFYKHLKDLKDATTLHNVDNRTKLAALYDPEGKHDKYNTLLRLLTGIPCSAPGCSSVKIDGVAYPPDGTHEEHPYAVFLSSKRW
jgi:hypothetical protein